MEFYVTKKNITFSFCRLTKTYLDRAVALCNSCVGENLYPRTELEKVVDDPDHFFYLLFIPKGEVVGYIYFFLTNLEEMTSLSKLPGEQLALISKQRNPIIGNLQSIGVAKEYRKHGISEILMEFYLSKLQEHSSVDVAFGVFWKTRGHVPMEKTLCAFHFIYLADAYGVWRDKKELICPFCQGRCICEAAVYYKPLEKEAIN